VIAMAMLDAEVRNLGTVNQGLGEQFDLSDDAGMLHDLAKSIKWTGMAKPSILTMPSLILWARLIAKQF
jgi:hypothetical protein